MWKPTSIILFVMPVFVTAGQAEDSRRNPHYAYAHQGGLTAPDSSPPREIASRYLRGRAVELGLQDADLSGLYLVKEYRTEHNGVTHLHYRQRTFAVRSLIMTGPRENEHGVNLTKPAAGFESQPTKLPGALAGRRK